MSPDEQSLDLAMRVERELVLGQPAYVAVSACCWVLADLVVQAVSRGEPLEKALALVLEQLTRNVDQLRQHGQSEIVQ